MQQDHLEFYPGSLEIQKRPPLPMSRYILWSIVLFFMFTFIWAFFSRIDIVAVAQGKIVPIGQIKIIQPVISGNIKAIHIQEGEYVSQGDVLIELDETKARAELEKIIERRAVLELEQTRLLRILEVVTSGNSINTLSNVDVPNEKLQFYHRYAKHIIHHHKSTIAALEEEKKQQLSEYLAITDHIQQLDNTIPLITEQVASIRHLLENKLVPRTQWLSLEQERIQQVKQRDILKNKLNSIQSAIKNIEKRIESSSASFLSDRYSELKEIQNQISLLEQESIKARNQIQQYILIAPVSGKIQELTMHTIGGVVTPAQELLKIVPDKEKIEVEAWLSNKDIGFVHEGQMVKIKVETFPFTKYGTVAGIIKTLSNDAISKKELGLVYSAKIQLNKKYMEVNEKLLNLSPGMAVTTEINLGKRRLLEYILSPLLRYKDESVRER